MSVIVEAIGSIVQKKLNGILLKAAQDGQPIGAQIGIGKPAFDENDQLGDESFTEQSRESVTTRIFSTEDPNLWVDVDQPIILKLRSREGRTIELNLKSPV